MALDPGGFAVAPEPLRRVPGDFWTPGRASDGSDHEFYLKSEQTNGGFDP